ncbi:transcription factor IIFalpha isoform X2 [Tachypleus tridentatus]
MKFNSSLQVDVSTWTHAKMERENNIKEFKADEEMPKYGAGSEFGRDQREEARRKKYGIISKKYNPDDQPWMLKVGGKGGKKFKGIREGGVTENASYYVFTQAPDGAFEAFPIQEWYNFTPIHRYKPLSAEEAEEEFNRRNKILNYFNLMKKRNKNEDDDDKEEGEKKTQTKAKGKNDFKISDMDDWVNDSDIGSGDEDDDDETKASDNENSKKKNQKKKEQKKKKKKKEDEDSEEEAKEESDEGDFDDREVDYITNSSSSEADFETDVKATQELKGVEDEDALRQLEMSDDEEEEEKEGEEGKEGTQEEPVPEPENKKKVKEDKVQSSGESSPDSSDSDFDDSKFHSAMFMQKSRHNGSDSTSSSRANTPTSDTVKYSSKSAQKRRAGDPGGTSAKRHKLDGSSSSSSEGITEDAVRRYLMRKPMTTTELLQKFKSKKTGLTSNQLVTTIAQILKRLNPEKQTIKGKLYLSIRS